MSRSPNSSRSQKNLARQKAETLRWRRLLQLLYGLSGFSCLTLETIWIRQITLWAGNTVVASTLVIAVFFLAAAAGNLWGGRLVNGRAHPLKFYGQFEVASGLTAVTMFLLSLWLWSRAPTLPGALAGQLGAAILLVGIPAFLSGVSFPSLAETFVPGSNERTSSGAPFYGMNLLGAAAGVAAGGVLLPWHLGLRGAFAVAVTLQIAGGLLAWHLATRVAPQASSAAGEAPPPVGHSLPAALGWGILTVSGVLSLAAQCFMLLWARQVFQGSVYALSSVLTAFIAGLGLGALLASHLRRKGFSAPSMVATFSLASAALLLAVPTLGTWLIGLQILPRGDTPEQLLGWALLSSIILLPLTTCLGVIFPASWEIFHAERRDKGKFLGSAVAWNKVGAAAGISGALFLILPLLGLVRSTVAVGLGYLLVSGVLLWMLRRVIPWRLVGLPVFLITGAAAWQMSRTPPVLGAVGDLAPLAEYQGAYGPVAVVENKLSGSRHILLNSQQQLSGTQQALHSQYHQSWVPLLLSPSPQRVVTIGMATGISAAAALDFPLQELYAVELVPEVAQAAQEHFAEWNAQLYSDPRAQVIVGDGRVAVMRLPGQFDVVICDLLFPAEDGAGNLYSREFFSSVSGKLSENGMFCLWLPCYQHDERSAGIIIRTFLEVFPHAIAVRANLDPRQPVLGLVGSHKPFPISQAFLAGQLEKIAGRPPVTSSPFFQSPANAALLLAGDLRSATPGFDEFPINTDDHMLLTFLGPREPRPGEKLLGLPFLNWIGKRFPKAEFPSCDLGKTSPDWMLGSVRAGNFYFAAANSAVVIPRDPRPPEQREQQMMGYYLRARALAPDSDFPITALGR